MRGPTLVDQVLFEVWFVFVGATLYATLRISTERIGRWLYRLVRRARRPIGAAR